MINEIQHASQLLPHIEIIADTDGKQGLFWLTGAQQFQMMKGVSETLAGRVAMLNLLGFSNCECRKLRLDHPPFLPIPEQMDARWSSAKSLGLQEIYRTIWTGGFPALVAGPVTERYLYYNSYG